MPMTILKNRVILRNFTKLMLIFFVTITICSLLIGRYATNVIKDEFVQSNYNSAVELRVQTEDIIRQCREIVANLAIDPMSLSFFSSKTPGMSYEGYNKVMQQKLDAYSDGISYINSVYLYSSVSKNIIASNLGSSQAYYFKDSDWLGRLSGENEGFSFFVRAISGQYPYVFTILYHQSIQNIECVIAMNIDLQSLYQSVASAVLENQCRYIVDNNSKIIVERVKSGLFVDISDVPELASFDVQQKESSHICKEDGRQYAYAQIQSQKYDFNYVSISNFSDYVEQMNRIHQMLLMTTFFMVIVACGFALLLSFSAFKPVKSIIDLLDSPSAWLDKSEKSDKEIQYISDRIISNLQANVKLRDELNDKLNLLNITQIQTLQLQISPHFLYNTLNIISMTVSSDMGDEYAPVVMLSDLAMLLRYSLESTDLVPLRVEKIYTGFYLHLLTQRYSESFKTEMVLPEEILDVRVPKLFLQPLIENSVFHGIAKSRQKDGLVRICGEKTMFQFPSGLHDAVRICVKDNGAGIEPQLVEELNRTLHAEEWTENRHIGVQNVAKRLQLLYQDNFHMEIESTIGECTKITIVFPLN